MIIDEYVKKWKEFQNKFYNNELEITNNEFIIIDEYANFYYNLLVEQNLKEIEKEIIPKTLQQYFF